MNVGKHCSQVSNVFVEFRMSFLEFLQAFKRIFNFWISQKTNEQ